MTGVVCKLSGGKKNTSLTLILNIQVPMICCPPGIQRLIEYDFPPAGTCEQGEMMTLASFGSCPNLLWNIALHRKHGTVLEPMICFLLPLILSIIFPFLVCLNHTDLLAIPGTPQTLSCPGPLLLPLSTFLSDLHDLHANLL